VLPEALEAAYRRTRYRVSIPRGGALDLRIGRRCPALDRWLRARACRQWAFVTASNPGSRPLPDWRNAARGRGLARAIAAAGFRVLPARGEPEQGGWRAEASLLVLGMPAARAVRLGRQFRQIAIVAGRRGGVAQLCWCGPVPGKPAA